MLDWVLFLSQLALWVLVIQLYRTRAQERQMLRLAAEPEVQARSEEFDFLDSEAVTRMSTIRGLLDQIEERTQRLNLDETTPSIPPIHSSAAEREVLSVFVAPAKASVPRPSHQGVRGASGPMSQWERLGAGSAVPFLPQRERLGEDTSRAAPTLARGLEVPSPPPSPIAMGEGGGPDRPAVATVGALAASGLDTPSLARTTGRQREEVNLLLHLARQSGPGGSGGTGPLTGNGPERRQS